MQENRMDRDGDRDGFTMVEVIVALVILTVGLLGLAGSTGWVVRQTTFAGAVGDRTAARQSAIESVRSTPIDDVTDGARTVGRFTVTWSVTETTDDYKTIEVVTEGPGLRARPAGLPTMDLTVVDTFSFQMIDLRP